jgi:hypothetical protein
MEIEQSSQCREGRSSLDCQIQEDTRQRSVCFGRIKFWKEPSLETIKPLKPNLRRGMARGFSPQSYEKKSLASGASTCYLKLPEVPENGFVGNSNLRGNKRGPL